MLYRCQTQLHSNDFFRIGKNFGSKIEGKSLSLLANYKIFSKIKNNPNQAAARGGTRVWLDLDFATGIKIFSKRGEPRFPPTPPPFGCLWLLPFATSILYYYDSNMNEILLLFMQTYYLTFI